MSQGGFEPNESLKTLYNLNKWGGGVGGDMDGADLNQEDIVKFSKKYRDGWGGWYNLKKINLKKRAGSVRGRVLTKN